MKRTLLAIFLLFFMALTGCSNTDQSIENNAQQEISKDEAENIVLKQLGSDYKLAVSYKFSREQQKVWELRFITDFEPRLIKMVELDAKTGAIIREQEFEKVEGKILKGISKDEAEHVVLQKFPDYKVVDSNAISVSNQSIWEVELTKESYKPEVVRIVQVDANTSNFITVKDLIK